MNLLLGGGWRLVQRLPEKNSATVLVRGGPGAGKTLVGLQVAIDIATALAGDIVIACVEILPTEYQAQLQSARPDIPDNQFAVLQGEPRTMTPGESTASADSKPRLFAGLLTELDPTEPDLVAGLEAIERDARLAGGNPVVFVVDSLSEGYGLGGSARRESVDAVMKFAADSGSCLVLCEEALERAPSPWVFAVDTVLELGVEARERGRWIEVRKHRFGPSVSGRHELDVAGSGHPKVYPEPYAWIVPHRRDVLRAQGWHFSDVIGHGTPPLVLSDAIRPTSKQGESFEAGFALVTSPESGLARTVAFGLVPQIERSSVDLIIELDPFLLSEEARGGATFQIHYLPTVHGPARVLRGLVERFAQIFDLLTLEPHIRRLVIGDLGNVLTQTGSDWAEALRVFSSLVIDSGWGIPVITYEGRGHAGKTTAHAVLAKHADLVMEVEWAIDPTPTVAAVRERWRRQTRQLTWDKRLDAMPLMMELEELEQLPRAPKRETDWRR